MSREEGKDVFGQDRSSKNGKNKEKLLSEMPPKMGERLIKTDLAVEICKFDETALEIIRKSTFTTHNKPGVHRAVRAANILNDFFEAEHFYGKTILEFGPGHYSFALLARELGATVICVDRDPVFVELGRHLGFHVIDKDFHDVGLEDIDTKADGLWIKGAFNAARLGNSQQVEGFVRLLTRCTTKEGWGWCVTVNRLKNQESPEGKQRLDRWIETQRQFFNNEGWDSRLINENDRARYALKYSGSRYYFTKNLAQDVI